MSEKFKYHSFDVDLNLMYLIQQVTQDKTQDILAWFYGLANDVLEAELEKKKSVIGVRKELKWAYKDTAVPFKLCIWSSRWRQDPSSTANIWCNIYFPKHKESYNVTDLVNSFTEIGLQLDGDMPEFKKPEIKLPLALRKRLGIKRKKSE